MPINFKRLLKREKAINKYSDHLQTLKWEELRQDVLERDDFTCQSCGDTYELQVHHKTYKRLGNEIMDDLITLCEHCHNQLHSI